MDFIYRKVKKSQFYMLTYKILSLYCDPLNHFSPQHCLQRWAVIIRLRCGCFWILGEVTTVCLPLVVIYHFISLQWCALLLQGTVFTTRHFLQSLWPQEHVTITSSNQGRDLDAVPRSWVLEEGSVPWEPAFEGSCWAESKYHKTHLHLQDG